MMVFKLWRNCWQVAVLGFLTLAAGTGPACAGPDEDYAAGMIQYERNDFTNAMPLIRKAADAGNLDGVYGLATMYASGDGVKKDVQEARNLIVRAAEGGHQQATWVLAQAYIRGELGIPDDQRDGKDALKWITLAADKEFLPALEALEKAYRSGGYGLVPDIAKADELKLRINKHRGVTEKKPRRRGEKK